jgi:hypothetical protein
MKHLSNLFGLSLAVFFVVCTFAAPADAFEVKKGQGGTAIAEESFKPHDYIIVKADILPCVHHSILDNFDRLHFSEEQRQFLHNLLKSPEIKEMAVRAKEIKVLEEQAKKRFYTGTATRNEMTPQFEKIAALKVEHTLRFLEIQNIIFDMLSKEQHEELMKILAEQGI